MSRDHDFCFTVAISDSSTSQASSVLSNGVLFQFALLWELNSDSQTILKMFWRRMQCKSHRNVIFGLLIFIHTRTYILFSSCPVCQKQQTDEIYFKILFLLWKKKAKRCVSFFFSNFDSPSLNLFYFSLCHTWYRLLFTIHSILSIFVVACCWLPLFCLIVACYDNFRNATEMAILRIKPYIQS